MPLAAGDVMPLVLAAVPSFQEKWDQEVREDWADEESPGGRLGYMDAGEVVRHAIDLLTAGQRAEVAALFAVVERLHLEGDDYVQELATIGYLEDIQNALDRHPALTHGDVLPLLGKESRKWWHAVAVLGGRVPGCATREAPSEGRPQAAEQQEVGTASGSAATRR